VDDSFCYVLLGVLSKLKEPEGRRKLLDAFAKSKNFSPLDAEKWYSINGKEFKSAFVRIEDALIFI
jgi:DNA polymerase III delta subunit